MGKGKGKVALSLAVVKRGKIILEFEHFSDNIAIAILKRCCYVLPGKSLNSFKLK